MTYLTTYALCHPNQHNCKDRTANLQPPEKMAKPVTQGIPQDWTIHSTNSGCWWSCIRLQRNASYSHSDTLLMRRQVVQAAHKSGQEWYVRQADEQAKNNLKHQ